MKIKENKAKWHTAGVWCLNLTSFLIFLAILAYPHNLFSPNSVWNVRHQSCTWSTLPLICLLHDDRIEGAVVSSISPLGGKNHLDTVLYPVYTYHVWWLMWHVQQILPSYCLISPSSSSFVHVNILWSDPLRSVRVRLNLFSSKVSSHLICLGECIFFYFIFKSDWMLLGNSQHQKLSPACWDRIYCLVVEFWELLWKHITYEIIFQVLLGNI